MLQTIKYNITTRSCYHVLQHRLRPIQRAVIQRTFISVRHPFLYRTQQSTQKTGDYKQAKDMLKSIEEKQAIEKKEIIEAVKPSGVKKTMWQKVKQEAVHYWHGTKLLGLEIRISSQLAYKLLQGTKLSRRESRQVINKRRLMLI